MRKLDVLVVDDQARARSGVKALLAVRHLAGEFREAANGREAVAQVEATQPDVVLMDIKMPEMDGLEATRRIKSEWPGVKVLLLSMYPDFEPQALAAGADAFFCKANPPESLLEMLAEIASSLE